MIDIALSDEIPAGTNAGLIGELARWHPDIVWEMLAPRLEDPRLPFSKVQRWRLAKTVASYSSEPQRIADLEAYESRNVPPEARKLFLESVAAIRRNQRIDSRVLTELDRWIASRS